MQRLELMAYETQMSLETRQEVYVVSDLESLSATYLSYGTGSGSGSSAGSGGSLGFGIVMTPLMKENLGENTPEIKVTGSKIVVPYSGGLHDTFRYDRSGNIDEGHTTINLPHGTKIRVNTDPSKARKDNSFSKK